MSESFRQMLMLLAGLLGGALSWGLLQHYVFRARLGFEIVDLDFLPIPQLSQKARELVSNVRLKVVAVDGETGDQREITEQFPDRFLYCRIRNYGRKVAHQTRLVFCLPGSLFKYDVRSDLRPHLKNLFQSRDEPGGGSTLWLEPPALDDLAPSEEFEVMLYYRLTEGPQEELVARVDGQCSDGPIRPLPIRRGFTLIELLVVIAILALLCCLLFPVYAVA